MEKRTSSEKYAIYGLGPVFLTVVSLKNMEAILQTIFGFRKVTEEDRLHLYEVGEGGNGAQVIVEERTDIPAAMQGYGGVHHVAFRVDDHEELQNGLTA